MKKILSLLIVMRPFIVNISFADTFGTGATQFTIDFVTISGAANPVSSFGIINNDYRIEKKTRMAALLLN